LDPAAVGCISPLDPGLVEDVASMPVGDCTRQQQAMVAGVNAIEENGSRFAVASPHSR
jgi:hypothetical protein